MKRHEDALGIQEGALNVRAMAKSLVRAADEAASEGVGGERDAAVRMIVHRLARVCRVDLVSCGYDPETLRDTFVTLITECGTRAREGHPQEEEAVQLHGGVIMLQAAGLSEPAEGG